MGTPPSPSSGNLLGVKPIHGLMGCGGFVGVVLIIMAVTNPGLDAVVEEHRRQLDRYLKSRHAVERFVVSQLGPTSEELVRTHCRRQNLVFFSVFTWRNKDDDEVAFLGAFGRTWLFALEGNLGDYERDKK